MSLIVEYKPANKEELIAIMNLNVPTYFDESEIKDFLNYLDNEIEDYFVVKDKNDLVVGCGGINFEDEGATAIISWDMIHPAHHKMGYGRKLLEHRLQLIRDANKYKQVVVRTSQHTFEFYQKFGFELTDIKANYWAPGIDLYYMQIKI